MVANMYNTRFINFDTRIKRDDDDDDEEDDDDEKKEYDDGGIASPSSLFVMWSMPTDGFSMIDT